MKKIIISSVRPFGFVASRKILGEILRKNGYEIYFFSQENGKEKLPHYFKFIKTPSTINKIADLISSIFRLKITREFRKIQPQGLISFNIPNGLLFVLSPLIKKPKSAIMVMTGYGKIKEKGLLPIFLRKVIIILLSKFYTDFIFQNKFDYLQAKKFFPSKNIHYTFGAGIDTKRFINIKNFKIKSTRNISKQIIGYIGRPLKLKGFDYFVALSNMKFSPRNIVFVHYGEIPKNKKNSDFSYIQFKGFKENVEDIYQNIDLIVYLSNYGDGMPRVILEGLSAGCNVICFKNHILEDLNFYFKDQIFWVNNLKEAFKKILELYDNGNKINQNNLEEKYLNEINDKSINTKLFNIYKNRLEK